MNPVKIHPIASETDIAHPPSTPPPITNHHKAKKQNASGNALLALHETVIASPDASAWTISHDKLLREWKTRCFVEYFLQTFSLYVYQKYYNYISLPVIVLSTAAGASIFSSDKPAVRYMSASMAMVSGILSGLIRQLQPGEKSAQHYTYAKRWNNLLRNLQQTLSIPYSQRPKVDVYLAQVMSEMDAIGSSQPYPLETAISSFTKRFGRRNFDKFLYGEDMLQSIYARKMFSNIENDGADAEDMADIVLPMPGGRKYSPADLREKSMFNSIHDKLNSFFPSRRKSIEQVVNVVPKKPLPV